MYDALGRLTSVCELSGSGIDCGQNTAATGFKTTYTWDALDNLLSVTQGVQTRSFTYDALGRMKSERNPESSGPNHTFTYDYTYDSDGTCGTSAGDLVKRTDALRTPPNNTPNTTCFAYDSLHRQTAVTYPSGLYAGITPQRHFVYDSATVNGQTMQNAHGRLAEAYTTGPTGSPIITDLGFSYTKRGELADAWQWSTNSSGWYHTAATYWPNGPTGLVKTVTALGLPTWTYNPDGEGRINSVLAGANYLVSSTQYNNYLLPNWLPMIVNYGSGDKDTFTFDTNTGRMKQYQASVNTYTVTGNLTWNGNGSLGQLQIADTAYPTNSQTCAYQHDDLARISSVDCGSGHWGQTFAYDAFGNITKTAMGNGRSGPSFTPGYDPPTNHLTCTGCNYDNNGNLINDGPVPPGNTYSWDAEGNLSQFSPGGTNTVTMVYDALGRRVEQTGTQFVYGIDGGKLALMNHQTVSKAFAPLPAGSAAVYTGSTLAWYRHPDWLGSSWITSLASGTDRRSRDVSYSPFGDIAAENGPGTADHNFTGQNQDLTSILYDFPAREYSQGEGRWISPDPAGIAAVDPGNPQTWNRYGYVNNNPLSLIDPTGMGIDPPPSLIEYVSRTFELDGCLYLQMGTRTQYVDTVLDQKVYNYAWGGMSLLYCNPSGTGPHGPGGGGGANATQKCFTPNWIQRKGIPLQAKLARFVGHPVGIGLGGSGGAGLGKGVGFFATGSAQMVVATNGNAYLVFTYGGTFLTTPWLTAMTRGAGGVFGLQASSMNTQDPSDLSGGGGNFSGGVGAKLGVGADLSVTQAPSGQLVGQLTGTVGVAAGGWGAAGTLTTTTVFPSCSNHP